MPGVGRGLASFNGRYLMAGTPMLISDDLAQWHQPAGVAGYQTRGIAYRPARSLYASVGCSGTILTVDSPGLQGTAKRFSVPVEVGGIVHAFGKFVTGSLTSTNGVIWRRNDGHPIGNLALPMASCGERNSGRATVWNGRR